MVRNPHSNFATPLKAQQTRQLREQAQTLLRHLMEGREQSNQRLAELGQRDAIKCVTGRSAIEQAIATTRNMIDEMDALLSQLNAELDGAERQSSYVAGRVG